MQGDALAERLPNVTQLEMPESGHVPNMEEPERVNKVALDFL